MTDPAGEVGFLDAACGDGIGKARPEHAGELAALAAATFPLACPPSVTDDDVRSYVDEVLSPARFTEYLADPGRTLLVARRGGSAAAYTMLVHAPPADPTVASVIERRPSTEISKFYADAAAHGTGLAGPLMDAALTECARRGDAGVWLGVNRLNERARRFYAKQRFETVGTRRFVVGDDVHDDLVLARGL